ncbi:hypothetical protein FXV91_03150 [Methanosarcina sp. DH2]|uniref:hypothetical protein n=1 Tax=Methanosarcina sp. DH2 TaxID=2605639 RepID=UPI001E3AC90A|nr:hypothetical protein [Methanosarcina sp. DH2]MCC4769237.1 hypothetical protein [Methanosarcina sp. DH2]
MSETKWSEKDRVLPRRNSGEAQFGRGAIRERCNSGRKGPRAVEPAVQLPGNL